MPHKLFRFYRFCVIGFRFIWTCWIEFWVVDFPFSFLFLFCKCGELCKTNIHEYWETFRTHAILILSIRKLKKKTVLTGSCCDLKLSLKSLRLHSIRALHLWLCSFDFRLLFQWVHYILLLQLLSNNFL